VGGGCVCVTVSVSPPDCGTKDAYPAYPTPSTQKVDDEGELVMVTGAPGVLLTVSDTFVDTGFCPGIVPLTLIV
jgi:hypothetical protein